jgi:hypothetical protein
MFVHLDLGWMRHPFPLSSFKIASADQIDTIRGLGLRQVRWVPEKSELDEAPAAVAAPVAAVESPQDSLARQRRELLAAQRATTAQLSASAARPRRPCARWAAMRWNARSRPMATPKP